jgi:glycosyltransferase involved in cell wall biosynthesis
MSILSIIIPAYNEGATIQKLLDRVRVVKLIGGYSKQLIVVDDCSTDNTEEVVQEYITRFSDLDLAYFRHDVNRGKGAALHTGFEHARGEFIVVQDADLEYDPEEFNLLLKPVIDGFADVVYGSRFVGGRPHRILFFWHTIGNRFLTTLSNVFTDLNLTDMETCYKLVRADLLKSLRLEENEFGFEPEVTAKIAKRAKTENIRIYEVGISYYGRTYADGKKINWKDGVRAIYCIFKYNLFSK